LAAIFQRSRDHGLEPEALEEIARTWAPQLQITQDAVHKYLTTNIYYYLDEPCLEGLQLFYRDAFECGALPRVSQLCFAEPKAALI
jgi:chorismate dehydratase